MAFKKYVALVTVEHNDQKGQRQFAKPAGKGSSGIFAADFSEETEARLIERQAIRIATKKDLAGDDLPASEAVIDGDATEVTDDGLDKQSVESLKAIAETEKVDLGEATKKADIIAAIRKARETFI